MHTYTFWQLAIQYTIEIPIVQRDYAQGREDAKSKEIREKFLADLKYSLISKKPLELDFVYGKVNNKTFVPIDGQQRLTTLFLLHWYVGVRLGKEEIKKLSFSYKTRISARDFCTGLIKENLFLNIICDTFSDNIKNMPWFFLAWEKDPTVQSMLNMLDSIHQKFNDKHQLEGIWSLLTESNYVLSKDNPKLNELVNLIRFDEDVNQQIEDKLEEVSNEPVVSFKFLNLEEFELSDELYLKMNARGKALTDFENFKAWLIGYIQDKNFKITEKDWTIKLDKEWTDLFWKFRDSNNPIDNRFMRFFVEMALCDYVSKTDKKYDDKDLIQTVQNLAFADKKNISYYSNKYFEELKCFNKESLNFIFKTLDKLHTSDGKIKTHETVKSYINIEKTFLELLENKQWTYSKRVTLYGYLKFICEEEIVEATNNNFFHWMRVVGNIVENTTIDSPATFVGAIKGVDFLLQYKNDILKNLKDGHCDSVPFFRTQMQEEVVKANLIKSDSKWEMQIIEAENHPLFKGNIGFLLSKDIDLDQFIKRKDVAMQLFDETGVTVGKETNLLGRALLAVGLDLINDELWLGGCKAQYWKSHLKDGNYIVHILAIIDLIIGERKENYVSKIQTIIQDRNIDYSASCWKKTLIENGALFSSYSSYGRIIQNVRGINLYEQEKFSENTNAILIENNRNEIVEKLISTHGFKLENASILKCNKFYSGADISLLNNGLTFIFKKDKLFFTEDKSMSYEEADIFIDKLKKEFNLVV